jgi:pimeloyl-ACP methyl ester carboxylesterase
MPQTFDSSGSSDAPALVLVHGVMVTRKMWLPQLQALADTFYVLAPDLPGHGAQAHIPFSFAASVDILAQLIQQQAGGRALVAGLSLGG